MHTCMVASHGTSESCQFSNRVVAQSPSIRFHTNAWGHWLTTPTCKVNSHLRKRVDWRVPLRRKEFDSREEQAGASFLPRCWSFRSSRRLAAIYASWAQIGDRKTLCQIGQIEQVFLGSPFDATEQRSAGLIWVCSFAAHIDEPRRGIPYNVTFLGSSCLRRWECSDFRVIHTRLIACAKRDCTISKRFYGQMSRQPLRPSKHLSFDIIVPVLG